MTTSSPQSIFNLQSVFKKALQPIFIPASDQLNNNIINCLDLNQSHQQYKKKASTAIRSASPVTFELQGHLEQHVQQHDSREQQLFLEVDLNEEERREMHSNQVSLNQSNVKKRQETVTFHEKAIERVRDCIRSKARECPDNFYPEDIDKFLTDTWSVVRFFPEESLMTTLTESMIDKITLNVIHCLKWRKDVRIRDIALKYFPQQFFMTGLFNFGVDVKTGKRVIYIRGKQHKKFTELTNEFIQFGSCLFEKIDNDLKGNKVTLFLDLSDVSLESADVVMFRHFLDLMFNYFPSALDQVFIFEASWYLRPLVYFILRVVPEKYAKLVRMISKKDIHDIESSSIPDLVGGNMKTTSLEVPEGAISLDQFVEEHGLSPDIIDKAKKLYKLDW